MKRRRKKERSRKQLYDFHHIIPKSRLSEFPSTLVITNIVKVDRRRHNLYHQLFSNRTPEEIIELLVDEFWGGKWHFVYSACDEQKLYP